MPNIKPFGHKAILIEFEKKVQPYIHDQVLALEQGIMKKHGERIDEIVSTYNSIVVYFKEAVPKSLNIEFTQENSIHKDSKTWKIPVCYNSSFGLDLNEVSSNTGIEIPEIIELHSTPLYRFYFNGFLPGFMYLGGLNPKIHSPRKEAPRTRIPKGSVGIGGEQTGIYPSESPGGWNIIGQTPINLFDINEDSPSPLSPRDLIKFEPISRDKFERLHNFNLNLAKYNA